MSTEEAFPLKGSRFPRATVGAKACGVRLAGKLLRTLSARCKSPAFGLFDDNAMFQLGRFGAE